MRGRGDVEEGPMIEGYAGQRRRHFVTFVVDVFQTARRVRIVADQHEGLRSCRYIAPRQVWIAVRAQRNVFRGMRRGEGKLLGNIRAILEALACEFHSRLLVSARLDARDSCERVRLPRLRGRSLPP